MIYSAFEDKQLSLLGFGTMRLPLDANGAIDQEQVNAMTDYALAHGVNYFDTAYPYHESMSEIAIGKALARHPRESFYLADKYPGHQIVETYNPAEIFEEQLKKCGVEYFDFYLLHNVNEMSIATYMDPKWGILDYFKEQKCLGRIKHLGCSCHGRMPMMREWLDYAGKDMEFCQIQLNYLDWTLQEAKEKYELITEHGIPVWVMEPVRGGKLATLNEGQTARLREIEPVKSTASWGFRFLQTLPNVKMVLSGMSNMEQMVDNVNTFTERNALSDAEFKLLLDIAEELKDAVPCTACRYCCDGCPMGLNIPMLIEFYNDLRLGANVNLAMRWEALPAEKQSSACIGCGKCAKVCPQNINIPDVMKKTTELAKTLPSWIEISRQRAEAAAKQKAAAK